MAMTVADLIRYLENFPEDMEVGFAYDYGDHWSTMVVADVNEIEVRKVQYSEYHQMNKIYEPEEDEDEFESVVVLSSEELDYESL